jgi:Domain of unknown function (DUF5668)
MADVTKTRCNCAYCRARCLMGPVMLITIGLIFLIGQYSRYSIADFWPLILIAAGVVLVLQSRASKEGHIRS